MNNAMPVAPEKLLMTFSLAQVAEMVIGWENATVYAPEEEQTVSQDAITVAPPKQA